MGILISASDFKTPYAIPQQQGTDLEAFITRFEKKTLVEMLGADMFKAFQQDLDVNKQPQAPKWKAIYDPFDVDYDGGIVSSRGMVEVLKGIIFFEWNRDNPYKSTVQGVVKNAPDTSQVVAHGKIFSYYNESVFTYNAIQFYITRIKPEDYTDPKFNGQYLDISNPILC